MSDLTSPGGTGLLRGRVGGGSGGGLLMTDCLTTGQTKASEVQREEGASDVNDCILVEIYGETCKIRVFTDM